uniref:Uncharacterized protein n=1 Tax=Steinernema glaseri TaxID=37863 RepID=A0A1I7XY03_9BILA
MLNVLQGEKIAKKKFAPMMKINSLYCCKLMYITTAACIVTYVQLLLLTAHLAYVAARYVVEGHSLVLLTHLITCATQALFLAILYRGIKRANFLLLRIALLGLIIKVILAAAYLSVLIGAQVTPIERMEHLSEFPELRILVASTYLIFVVLSLVTVHRCYRYYMAIRAVIKRKTEGSRRLYDCCTDYTHYANHHATFATAPSPNEAKCKFDKKVLGTTCERM